MKKLIYITLCLLLLPTMTVAQVYTTIFEKNEEFFQKYDVLESSLQGIPVKKNKVC